MRLLLSNQTCQWNENGRGFTGQCSRTVPKEHNTLTFLGLFLGSKKAASAVESWMFTTSNRKYKFDSAKKTLFVCSSACSQAVKKQSSRNTSDKSIVKKIIKLILLPYTIGFKVVIYIYLKIPYILIRFIIEKFISIGTFTLEKIRSKIAKANKIDIEK